MSVHHRVFAAVVLAASAAASNGDATDDAALRGELVRCASEAVASVQRRYESVRDLEARFEQRTQSVALGTGAASATTQSSGRVVFAKPGRMRWAYERPRQSLVVSDGEVMWLFDPESGEAQRLPVTSGYLTGAALSFLFGEGRLADEFVVTADDCADDIASLVLVPRKEASYERLGLGVVRSTGAIRSTSIVDLFGNVTQVSFEDLQTNRAPPASAFEFVPPEGTRVVDLVQGP